jgi:hypothetical protein
MRPRTSRLRIMHHLPFPPLVSPDNPKGSAIKGYAAGPATRILDLELDMGGVDALL